MSSHYTPNPNDFDAVSEYESMVIAGVHSLEALEGVELGVSDAEIIECARELCAVYDTVVLAEHVYDTIRSGAW